MAQNSTVFSDQPTNNLLINNTDIFFLINK